MKKSKQLIGWGIVNEETGKIIGKIDSVLFLPGLKRILGFIVGQNKWLKNKKALLTKDIKSIGKDIILVEHCNVLLEIEEYPELMEAIDKKNKIMNLKVITNTGEEMGFIEDIVIDEKNYEIIGYVLTDGITEDILNGKSVIPFTDEIVFSENAIIINNTLSNVILKNDISLKKVFKTGRRFKNPWD